MSPRRALLVSAVLALGSSAALANETSLAPVQNTALIIPATVPASCKQETEQPQILFDLCADQLTLLREAQQKAKETNKLVLVSFGADWCIWCHVFEAHILGKFGRYTYPTNEGPWAMDEKLKWQSLVDAKVQSAALRTFVAEQFVVVNIGQQAADGGVSVLKDTQAEAHFPGGLPFIYALDNQGKFAGAINSSEVEIRRDGRNAYRGYKRAKLMDALKSLADNARSGQSVAAPKPIQ